MTTRASLKVLKKEIFTENNRAVKKTLIIPEWLNEEALAMNINFSQVLQEALNEGFDRFQRLINI